METAQRGCALLPEIAAASLTILVKNCGSMGAEGILPKLYKGTYVFSIKVERKFRLSLHRIQRLSVLFDDVRSYLAV